MKPPKLEIIPVSKDGRLDRLARVALGTFWLLTWGAAAAWEIYRLGIYVMGVFG